MPLRCASDPEGIGGVRVFRSNSTRLAAPGLVGKVEIARFEGLYDRTFYAVYRYVYRASRNPTDAEDLTSETYERALRNLPRFHGRDDDLDRWIFGIARNVLREWWRNRDRLLAPLTQDQEQSLAGDVTPSQPDLSPIIQKLTPMQREVLEMRLAGLKVREIAAILGKAEGTVKALQFAALRNLRKAAHVE